MLLTTMVDGALTNAPAGSGNCWWHKLLTPEPTATPELGQEVVGLLKGAALNLTA